MDQLAISFKRYLKETLDIDARSKQWPETGKLQIFLRNKYVFFEVRILGLPCLIMAVKGRVEQTPATIQKHMLQVRKKWQDEVIYVQQKVTSYNRKRLIQHKIPFIVPLNQMYLPFLGIDLREHFKNIRETEASFSPSTQVVVLYYLSQNDQFRLTPKTLANKPFGVKAGLSALAYYSNLAEPANPVLALEGKQWKKVKTNGDLMILDIVEPNASELEIWSYSPKMFGENVVVDRFSLFLSMREDNNERVQSALKGMLEQVEC